MESKYQRKMKRLNAHVIPLVEYKSKMDIIETLRSYFHFLLVFDICPQNVLNVFLLDLS